MMPLSALYQQLRQAPDDDIATIADRLASDYGWSTAVRDAHCQRLYDIRGATMWTLLDESNALPGHRTNANLEQYIDGLDRRVAAARVYRATTKDR